ncbi:hypothetical protein X848_gp31 [Edwardsiella phage PEi21]|uniref:Uncharacterized protein n=1 Tax=Edwardsiella phage PEi21 TaxID=1325372 RepID=N0DP68_9CAUD|nr:hypothetical protein X848_gp31 [Edwardsiella phage PEi21]QXV72954.1 hypothetical protein [Edwardsiella phage PVN06]BAN16841.1 hypothetical protein [Edwardsiella phage PEi21]
MQTVKGVLLVLVLAFAGWVILPRLTADGWANVIGFLFIASMLKGRK